MGAAGKPRVILLVEDDKGDQELIRRSLASGRVRSELYIVEDGEEALDYLCQRGRFAGGESCPLPDLILLDINLPRLDGKEVLRRIKADARLRHIPVVMLTTSQQEQDVLRSYANGANSFITKPARLDEFSKVIQGLQEYWFKIVTLHPGVKSRV
jgi:CheY-like chemotaxis protein